VNALGARWAWGISAALIAVASAIALVMAPGRVGMPLRSVDVAE
jgi:hypothetical protein